MKAFLKKYRARIIMVVSVVFAFSLGFGGAYAWLQPRVSELEDTVTKSLEKISASEVRIGQLESGKMTAELERTKLETLLSAADKRLAESVKDLEAKKSELEKAQTDVSSAKEKIVGLEKKIASLKESTIRLDADKKLMLELRKDPPFDRAAATQFWKDLRSLAVQSDPSLGPTVDSVIINVNGYFSWIESNPGLSRGLLAFCNWIITAPAEAFLYGSSISTLQRSVLLVVVTHITTAIESLGE